MGMTTDEEEERRQTPRRCVLHDGRLFKVLVTHAPLVDRDPRLNHRPWGSQKTQSLGFLEARISEATALGQDDPARDPCAAQTRTRARFTASFTIPPHDQDPPTSARSLTARKTAECATTTRMTRSATALLCSEYCDAGVLRHSLHTGCTRYIGRHQVEGTRAYRAFLLNIVYFVVGRECSDYRDDTSFAKNSALARWGRERDGLRNEG